MKLTGKFKPLSTALAALRPHLSSIGDLGAEWIKFKQSLIAVFEEELGCSGVKPLFQGRKRGAYMDVLAAFLRKNDLIPYSEASDLADYFLTDQCSRQVNRNKHGEH